MNKILSPRVLAVLAVIAFFCVYARLYGSHLQQPALYEDEAYFPDLANNGLKGHASSVPLWQRPEMWTPFPHIGGIEAWKQALVLRFFPPSLRLIRIIAVTTGLLALSLVFLFAFRLAGPACGIITAWLVMADPNFFVNIRHDYSAVGNAMVLEMACALAWLAWWRLQKTSTGALAAWLTGLTLWNHALSLVPLGAMALSTALLFRAELTAKLESKKVVGLMAAGLCLGAFPLLWQAVQGRWILVEFLLDPTYKNGPGTDWGTALLWKNIMVLARTLQGQSVQDFILDSVAPKRPLGLGLTLAGGVAYWSWDRARLLASEARWRWAGWTLLIASALLLCVPSLHGSHHVVIALYPWIHLLLALAAQRLCRQAGLAPWPRAAALGLLSLTACLGLRTSFWIRQNILEDRVIYKFSSQVARALVESLEGTRLRTVPLAWGLARSLHFLHGRDLRIADGQMMDRLENINSPGEREEALRAFKRFDALYVLQPEDLSVFPTARRNFFRLLREEHLRATLLRRVEWAVGGRTVFEIYRIDPGKAAGD